MSAETFGDRVRALRRAREWRQEDLARLLGCRAWSVCRWERGYTIPNRARLYTLAGLLGTTAYALLNGDAR